MFDHSGSFTPQATPSYADLTAVLAGLTRLGDDLNDLAAEAGEVINAVRQAMQTPGDKDRARQALANQQAQLVWLAADTGAMLAALADAKGENMSEGPLANAPVLNPVLHLYALADSILHLGATLPEEQAGLALLLVMISEEVKECARILDDNEDTA